MRKVFILIIFYSGCVRNPLLGFKPRLRNPYAYMATTDVIILPEDYDEDVTRAISTTVSAPKGSVDSEELYVEADTEPSHWVETYFPSTDDSIDYETPLFIKKINKERLKNHSKISFLRRVHKTLEAQSSTPTITPEQYEMFDNWPATHPDYNPTRRTTEYFTIRWLTSDTSSVARTWRSYFPPKAPKTCVSKTEPVYDEHLRVTWRNYVPWRVDFRTDYSTVSENYRRIYSPIVHYRNPIASDQLIRPTKPENTYITEYYSRTFPPTVHHYTHPVTKLVHFNLYEDATKLRHFYSPMVKDYRKKYSPQVQFIKPLDSYEPYKFNPFPLEDQETTTNLLESNETTFLPDTTLDRLRLRLLDHESENQNGTNRCYQCAHNETCHNIFDQEDERYRHERWRYRKICSGETFIGGCYKRYLDVDAYFSERGCRHLPPEMWSSLASLRFNRLEYLLMGIHEGCTSSPVAGLLPLSRPISLYVRFHVCVCINRYCNSASMLSGIFFKSLFFVLYFVCMFYMF